MLWKGRADSSLCPQASCPGRRWISPPTLPKDTESREPIFPSPHSWVILCGLHHLVNPPSLGTKGRDTSVRRWSEEKSQGTVGLELPHSLHNYYEIWVIGATRSQPDAPMPLVFQKGFCLGAEHSNPIFKQEPGLSGFSGKTTVKTYLLPPGLTDNSRLGAETSRHYVALLCALAGQEAAFSGFLISASCHTQTHTRSTCRLTSLGDRKQKLLCREHQTGHYAMWHSTHAWEERSEKEAWSSWGLVQLCLGGTAGCSHTGTAYEACNRPEGGGGGEGEVPLQEGRWSPAAPLPGGQGLQEDVFCYGDTATAQVWPSPPRFLPAHSESQYIHPHVLPHLPFDLISTVISPWRLPPHRGVHPRSLKTKSLHSILGHQGGRAEVNATSSEALHSVSGPTF